MNQLEILIPFSLPPTEMAQDLFRELSIPALATLLSRARTAQANSAGETFSGFRRSLPHESWLANRFGLGSGASNSSPAVAPALMQSLGLDPGTGTWFVLQPVHIHIARDHLVLTDPKQLILSEAESRTFYDIAAPLFEEAGKSLKYGCAGLWFVRADDWGDLQTSTPDASSGHNIDIWMPKGTKERDWRKVQNDVQMHWFNHSVNEQRESAGQRTVNSLWLWGGASPIGNRTAVYDCVFNMNDWMQFCWQFSTRHAVVADARELIASGTAHSLLVLDALRDAALVCDWAGWLAHMHELESAWFMPILQGLKTGKLDEVTFVLTHDTRISQFTVTRSTLRKFWVKPTLAPLCP